MKELKMSAGTIVVQGDGRENSRVTNLLSAETDKRVEDMPIM
jgi:hypothetical protein